MRANLAATATTFLLRSNLISAFETPSVVSRRAYTSLRLSTRLAGGSTKTIRPYRTSSTMAMAATTSTRTSMPALPTFLSQSHDIFASATSGDVKMPNAVRITIGNEAGDADSIVSALVHSYVLRLEEELRSENHEDKTWYAPLVGVPRADLPLRRETTLLLGMAGVDLDQLLFVDSPPLIASLLMPTDDASCGSTCNALNISLVDHNRIRSSLRHLDDHVVEILDHHEDEGYHTVAVPEGSDARNIAFRGRDALVGSTCALVVERMLQAADSMTASIGGGDKDVTLLDPSASLCLLGVILLDTMNMSSEAGKGTDRDLAAINSLLDRTDWSMLDTDSMEESARAVFEADGNASGNIRPNRAALHDLLRNSKFDEKFWSDMSVYDCLRIDYKRFEPTRSSYSDSPSIAFGMSSVLLPLSNFLSKADCVNSIARYIKEVETPLLGVLSMTVVDDTPHREMLLAGRPDLVDAAAEYLLKSEDAAFLEVTEVECVLDRADEDKDGMKLRKFRQGNPKGSRKQVAPTLMRLAATLS